MLLSVLRPLCCGRLLFRSSKPITEQRSYPEVKAKVGSIHIPIGNTAGIRSPSAAYCCARLGPLRGQTHFAVALDKLDLPATTSGDLTVQAVGTETSFVVRHFDMLDPDNELRHPFPPFPRKGRGYFAPSPFASSSVPLRLSRSSAHGPEVAHPHGDDGAPD